MSEKEKISEEEVAALEAEVKKQPVVKGYVPTEVKWEFRLEGMMREYARRHGGLWPYF